MVLLFFSIDCSLVPNVGTTENSISLCQLLGFSAPLLAGLSWYTYRTAKFICHSSVSVDCDGIWPAHLEKKTALIPWSNIFDIKEKNFQQRLELIDSGGNFLLKVDYQLSEFSILRYIIAEKTMGRMKSTRIPITFSSPLHLYQIIAFSGTAIIIWDSYAPKFFLLVIMLIGCFLFLYKTTPSSITIANDHLTIAYPGSKKAYVYKDIISIGIGDTFSRRKHQTPTLFVTLASQNKPLNIEAIGTSTITLYQILSILLEKNQSQKNAFFSKH